MSSKLPFDPNELFKIEVDPEKAQLAILALTMQNQALLKVITQIVSEDVRTDDLLKEYESQLAHIWAKVMPQVDIENQKDIDI